MKTQTIVLIIIGIVIISGGSFFAGTKYQQSRGGSQFSAFGGNSNRGNRAGQTGGMGQNARTGYRPVNGDIVTVSDKGMSVKIQDGSTRLVLFTDKTPISKASAGAVGDLQTGVKVLVFGQDNPDGTLTAQSIQLNPPAGMGFGRPNPSGTPTLQPNR